MAVYAQLVVAGLTTGAVYGLLALGIVVIYRASRVLNFAHAGIAGLGAYVLHDLMDGSGGAAWPFLAAFATGAAVAAAAGVATELLAVRRVRHAAPLAPVAATAGLLLLTQALLAIRYGARPVGIENPLPRTPYPVGRHSGIEELGAVVITSGGALTLAVLVAVGLALVVAVSRTRWGLALRAVSHDAGSAAELGVRTGRLSLGAWALGSAVGAVAVMLMATTQLLVPVNLVSVQIKALVVAIFAGLSDLRLCIVGGPLLGVVEALLQRSGVAGLDQSIGFFALLLVLVARSRTLMAEARA